MHGALSPELLLEALRMREEADAGVVKAYWVAISSSRERFADTLRELGSHDSLVVVKVKDGFSNPNAVLTDFVEVLNANRQSVCDQMERIAGTGRTLRFVLLARAELTVPQAASPVQLPAWLPCRAGATVEIFLEDLTWTTDAPLSDARVNTEDTCELLFELDRVLASRMQFVYSRDHSASGGLVGLLNNVDKTAGSIEQILAKAANSQKETVTTRSFRPSARGGSIVGRINVLAANTPVEKLNSTCKNFARAVMLPEPFEDRFHEAVTAVLARPVTREADRSLRFSRNLILTTHHSCQLITAAAHADQYERYPVPLLKSLSLDLRRSLDSAIAVLKSLEVETIGSS